MMDFSAGAGLNTGGGDLIPNGQVAWAIVNVRGKKASQKGGSYLDIELTIDEGQPYARRKIWDMVGNPFDQNNSEAYRQMGMAAVARMLESGRGAGPNNAPAYNINDFTDLSGLRVAIKVKIEKGTGGYDDKNKVAEWLTPNPQSSGNKDFLRLQRGEYGVASNPAPQAAQSGFGFGGAAPQTGFQQPQQSGASNASAAVSNSHMAPSPQGTAPNAMTSPSSQPSWLAQANGQ